MKLKRQKHSRRVLKFYERLGFVAPFKILVDATFCKAALANKINIAEQLPKYLFSSVTLSTTKCVLDECRQLGSLLYGPLKILLQYSCLKCGHQGKDKSTSARDCLRLTVESQRFGKFFLATQDSVLSEFSRSSNVPLLYIAYNTVTLESPSAAQRAAVEAVDLSKSVVSADQLTGLSQLQQSVCGSDFSVEAPKPKKRRIKGPNPLSCKPKRRKPVPDAADDDSVPRQRKKRHRRRPKRTPESSDGAV